MNFVRSYSIVPSMMLFLYVAWQCLMCMPHCNDLFGSVDQFASRLMIACVPPHRWTWRSPCWTTTPSAAPTPSAKSPLVTTGMSPGVRKMYSLKKLFFYNFFNFSCQKLQDFWLQFFGMLGHQSRVYSVHFYFICHYIIFALLLYCVTILQVCTVLQQLCPSTQYCIPRSQEIILGKHIPPLKQSPAYLPIPCKTILASGDPLNLQFWQIPNRVIPHLLQHQRKSWDRNCSITASALLN